MKRINFKRIALAISLVIMNYTFSSEHEVNKSSNVNCALSTWNNYKVTEMKNDIKYISNLLINYSKDLKYSCGTTFGQRINGWL